MRYEFSHWLAGYNKFLVSKYGSDDDGGEDNASRAKLNVIGVSVGLACILVPVNWTIGSSHWTIGQGYATRIAVSAFSALFGLLLVITIDRSVVFAMDVNRKGKGIGWYIVLRMLMVLAVGLFTSEQIIPFVMRPALMAKSAQEGEAFRSQGIDRNLKESNLAGWSALYDGAQRRESQARSQWENSKSNLNRSLLNLTLCQEERDHHFISCDFQRAHVAQDRLIALKERSNLDKIVDQKNAAYDQLFAANARYGQYVINTNQRNDEADVVRSFSSTELYKLIETDLGARIEFIVIMFILTTIELMPVLTKAMVGRTNIGYAIYVDDVVRQNRLALRELKAESDTKIALVIGKVYVDVFQLEEIRQRTLGDVSKDVLPHIKSHLIMRMYEDLVRRIKSVTIAEMNDRTDYGSSAPILTRLFNDLMNKIKAYLGDADRA